MKQKLFLLFALFALTLLNSCSKSGSDSDGGPVAPTEVIITAVSPEKLLNGSQVTVTGENFGTDTTKVRLTLDGQKMVITALTNTSITFTIPQKFVEVSLKNVPLKVEVDGLLSDQLQVLVYYYFQEPHGWFYAGTIPNSGGASSQIFKNLIFPTDSIGYAQREKAVYHTLDGGINWFANGSNGGLGLGYAIASSDGLNTWLEFASQVAVSANGTKFTIGPEGSSFDQLIIGLYTTGPANGLIAASNGRLFDVNGSFAGATIKYQSATYNNGGFWTKMSVLDKNNLIIAANDNIIVLEKAGVFSEVNISSVATSVIVKNLQLVDANTAFLIDGNNALIKYASNTWTKLTQPANAVYFINSTTGYIAYNNKILKTTNGGATWNEEFTLNATEKVAAICARNGKIWVLGNSDTQGFVLKYNP